MYVEHNALSGPLPPQLALMESLTSLVAGFNAFEGPILPELFGLTQVRPHCAAACALAEAAAAARDQADPPGAWLRTAFAPGCDQRLQHYPFFPPNLQNPVRAAGAAGAERQQAERAAAGNHQRLPLAQRTRRQRQPGHHGRVICCCYLILFWRPKGLWDGCPD